MNKENQAYLEKLIKRNEAYDEVRGEVISFILENKIENADLCTDLFVIGFLYQSRKLNEDLTAKDICILLGENDDDFDNENPFLNQVERKLTETLSADLTLRELMEVTVDSFA